MRLGAVRADSCRASSDDLDLGPLEEPATAAHAERDAGAAERLFEQRRLRVDPVEDGEARPRHVRSMGGAKRASNAARFVVVGVVRGDRRERALRPRRAHRGTVPGGSEHRARGRHDLRGGAVVAPETNDPDVGEPLGRELRREPHEERRVGTGEPVDRLVAVADDAEVGAVAEPCSQQPELSRARVLELVDEEMAEAPALRGGEVGVAFEHVGAARDEVVEVDEAAAPLLALVLAVHLGHFGGRAGRRARGERDRLLVAVGAHEPRLGPLDLGRELGGAQPGLAPADVDERERAIAPCARAAWASCVARRPRGGAAARARSRGTCPR